jgi:hypothetical protein
LRVLSGVWRIDVAVLQGRTREQLRISVGRNVSGRSPIVSSATAQGNSGITTLIDTTLTSLTNDDYNGWYILFTSGTNDGTVREVLDYTGATDTLTWLGAASLRTESGDTYELWHPDYSPDLIHEFVNQAIAETTGRLYDPVESVALHSDGSQSRFDLPANISMIKRLQRRTSYTGETVHACDTVWDEAVDAEFTQTVDTEFWKLGGSSLKVVVGVNAAASDIISDSFAAIDMSNYTHVEFWIYSTVLTAAGALLLHMNDSPVQVDNNNKEDSLSIPVIPANTWTFVRIPLNSPNTDTAITSVGIEYVTDLGAMTFYVDDIKVVNNDRMEWSDIPDHTWHTNIDGRDIILEYPGSVGYTLLKIIGGDKPALLTSDTSVTEVPDQWVINKASVYAMTTAPMHFMSTPVNINMRQNAANRAWAAFPMLQNVRRVE